MLLPKLDQDTRQLQPEIPDEHSVNILNKILSKLSSTAHKKDYTPTVKWDLFLRCKDGSTRPNHKV